MCLRHRLYTSMLLVSLAVLFSCTRSLHNAKGVEAAMRHYDYLIKKLDADAIAQFYTPDGDLGAVAHGRDSIRKFLTAFKNVQVLSQVSTTDSLIISGNGAVQKGTYRQTDVIGNRDTVHVKGTYTATWLWMKGSGWHIQRMDTKPA